MTEPAPPADRFPWHRALVTGASSGIGRAMARALAALTAAAAIAGVPG